MFSPRPASRLWWTGRKPASDLLRETRGRWRAPESGASPGDVRESWRRASSTRECLSIASMMRSREVMCARQGFRARAYRPTCAPPSAELLVPRGSVETDGKSARAVSFRTVGSASCVDSCDEASQKASRGVVSRRCARAARPRPRWAGPRFEEVAVRLLGRRRRRPPRRHVRRTRGNRQVVPRCARRWLAPSRRMPLMGAPWPPLRRDARAGRRRELHWVTSPPRRTSLRRPPPTARSTRPTSRLARTGAPVGS